LLIGYRKNAENTKPAQQLAKFDRQSYVEIKQEKKHYTFSDVKPSCCLTIKFRFYAICFTEQTLMLVARESLKEKTWIACNGEDIGN
jgi:hypothetical protein